MSRRSFFKLLGASLALAGLAGCVNVPARKIVPYVKSPDSNQIPGKSLYYTTAMTHAGYAMGLLVESNEGRPTKIEGNPDHPASLGSTDTFAQAAVLGLYDPARSTTVLRDGQAATNADFNQAFAAAVASAGANGGSGIRIVTEVTSSPTLIAQIESILAALPSAQWIQWEPAANDQAEAGARLAFGRDANTVYRFDRADTVLSLDSDFLQSHADTLRYSRDFIDRRRVKGASGNSMNRLYAVEGTPTLTGAKADHRLRVLSRDVLAVALAVAGRVGVGGLPAAPALPETVPAGFVDALARDLQAHTGASIVIAGNHQAPAVHALAHAMNAALGNAGKTVLYTEPVVARPGDRTAALRDLVIDMNAGAVQLLLILGANPAYTAPADLGFAEAMRKVGTRVHLGLYVDETAALSNWHVPQTHFLEAWSDARAFDGTVSIVQPLIEPLYAAARSVHEILPLMGGVETNSYEQVRGYWQQQPSGERFRDLVAGDAQPRHGRRTQRSPRSRLRLDRRPSAAAVGAPALQGGVAQGLEVNFKPDPAIWDGRFANNAWLQELPKPLNLLTWDNAVMMSPATAEQLGVGAGGPCRSALRRAQRPRRGVDLAGARRQLGDGAPGIRPVGDGSEQRRLRAGNGFNAYALRTARRRRGSTAGRKWSRSAASTNSPPRSSTGRWKAAISSRRAR